MSKLVWSIKEAIALSGLKDGMTVSFHHHLRNGLWRDKIPHSAPPFSQRSGKPASLIRGNGRRDCKADSKP